MSGNVKLFTGTKSIPLEALPEAAWTVIGGYAEDDERGVANLRKKVAVMNRCINIRSDSVGIVPWVITDLNDNEVWTSEEQEPPPQLAWAKDLKRYLNMTESALCLRNEAFWHIERTRGKQVLALKWLSPLTVKPKWDKEKGLINFERHLSPTDIRVLKLEDVVHIWLPDPLHETVPDSPPAEAALAAAQALFSIDQFVASFFDRGAIKATLLTIEGNPSREEKSRLKAWWDRFFKGETKSWGTEVVSANVKPVSVGEGIGELSNTDLTTEKREEIAIAFGIPHSMLFSDAANFATSKQDKRNFYDETIEPELGIIAPPLNETLFNPLGFRFSFRLQSMDLYQEDEGERAAALGKLVAAGFPMETAAETLGIKLPQGMTYEILGQIATPPQLTLAGNPSSAGNADEAPQKALDGRTADLSRWERKALKRLSRGEPADCPFESEHLAASEVQAIREALAVAEDKRGVSKAFLAPGRFLSWISTRNGSWSLSQYDDPSLSAAARRSLFASYLAEPPFEELTSLKAMVLQIDPDDPEANDERDERSKIERRATTRITGSLGDAANEVISGNEDKLTAAPESVDMGALLGAPERVAAAHRGGFADALRAALAESADLGVRIAADHLDTLSMSFDWTLPNLDARDWAATYAGTRISGIAATSERATRQAIARWVENGEPLRSLQRDLEPLFGRKRAELIASTEVTAAYAEGNRIAYRASGVVGKMQWNTAFDERVCPICGPLNGTQVDLERGFTEFPNGLPPAHPRCRCMVLPVIDRSLIRKQIAGD